MRRQFLRLGLQQLIQGFFHVALDRFLDLALDYFLRGTLFGCIIFSDMVCFLLSEWCVATSFYQRSANHVSFYAPFYLRNLLYLIRHIDPTLLATKKYRLVFGKKLAGIF